MVFRFPNGKALWKIVSAVEKDEIDGRKMWRIQTRRMFGSSNQGVTNVIVDTSDLVAGVALRYGELLSDIPGWLCSAEP